MVVDPELDSSKSPLARLIAFSAQNYVITILLVAAFAAWGYRSLMQSPLDAIPDLSDVQVIVFTDWPGRSPDLVEDQITYPLTTTLLAAPEVRFVRGQSFMGLSFVYVIFEDGTDIYWARSRVSGISKHRCLEIARGGAANAWAGRDRCRLGVPICAGRSKRQSKPRRLAKPAGF